MGVPTMKRERRLLKLVTAPAIGAVVDAPPVLNASDATIEFVCGRCQTPLMHAQEGQVFNVYIRCRICGSYNITDNDNQTSR